MRQNTHYLLGKKVKCREQHRMMPLKEKNVWYLYVEGISPQWYVCREIRGDYLLLTCISKGIIYGLNS